RLVTPIDHQHLPGEVPAAVEYVLADPPSQLEVFTVLLERDDAGIVAAARVGAAGAINPGERRRFGLLDLPLASLIVLLLGLRALGVKHEIAEEGRGDPRRLFSVRVLIDAFQGTLECVLDR